MHILFPILLALLLAGPAIAAPNTTHGQSCDSDVGLVNKGQFRVAECVNLCNNHAQADDDSECTEYEFKGVPDLVILEREENDANCSGDPTFTFTTGPTTGGSPSYALDTTAVVLNDATPRVVFVMANGIFDSFLFIAVSNDTACTDVDVRMYLATEED